MHHPVSKVELQQQKVSQHSAGNGPPLGPFFHLAAFDGSFQLNYNDAYGSVYNL